MTSAAFVLGLGSYNRLWNLLPHRGSLSVKITIGYSSQFRPWPHDKLPVLERVRDCFTDHFPTVS
jgi:hypothetical protein